MKVKAADEAKGCIARRKSFRWMGWRGMKSKTAEGVYGLFYRKGMPTHEHYKVTLLLAVYEPRTAMWYTTEQHVAEIRSNRIDVPENATPVKWVNGIWLLQDAYKRGYPALVEARLLGHL
jgi:hypothetical protein